MEKQSVDQTIKKLYRLLLVLWLWRCLSAAIISWLFMLAFHFCLFIPIAALLAAVVLIQGLIHLGKEKRWKNFFITLVCVAALALPWTNWYEDARFWLLKPQMEVVAERIITEMENDPPTYSKTITLPPQDFFLSRNLGKVTYYPNDNIVFFFSQVGILDNYAGYLYFSSGEHYTIHTTTEAILYDHYYGICYWEDKGTHWEYCVYN